MNFDLKPACKFLAISLTGALFSCSSPSPHYQKGDLLLYTEPQDTSMPIESYLKGTLKADTLHLDSKYVLAMIDFISSNHQEFSELVLAEGICSQMVAVTGAMLAACPRPTDSGTFYLRAQEISGMHDQPFASALRAWKWDSLPSKSGTAAALSSDLTNAEVAGILGDLIASGRLRTTAELDTKLPGLEAPLKRFYLHPNERQQIAQRLRQEYF